MNVLENVTSKPKLNSIELITLKAIQDSNFNEKDYVFINDEVKRYPGGNTETFFGGNITKKCDHNCDQALKKWTGDLYRVYIY